MAHKRCARCAEYKDEDEFNWRWKALGVRQSICRDCSRRQSRGFYEAHRESEKKRTYEVTRNKRERAKRFVYDYLSERRCADCGEYDFSVLTFDHVRGIKKKEVMAMVTEGYAIEAILDEISKCEVVCANCHMRREQRRRGKKGRFSEFWPESTEDYDKWWDDD